MASHVKHQGVWALDVGQKEELVPYVGHRRSSAPNVEVGEFLASTMEPRFHLFSLMLALLYVFADIFFRILLNNHCCSLVLSMDEHTRIFACNLMSSKDCCTKIFASIFVLNVDCQK